jgi:non-specific serine/threonine protein kinase
MLAGGDVASGQRMAVELVEFWWLRGNPIEGRAWLERALAAPPEPSLRMRAALRTGLAEVLWAVGDYVRSLEHSSAALEVWQEVGDEPGAAACLHHMAVVAHDLGDYTRAARLYETSLQIYRTLGDVLSAIRCQADLGLAVMHQGDLGRAAALQEEALALARLHDEPTLVANGVFNLAEIYRRLGDTARAVAHYRDSLVTHWALRERKFVIDDLLGLALMAAELRQDEDAAWLAGADAHMREEIGARITPQPERVAYERALERVRARMGHPAFTAAKTAGGEAGERAAIPTAIEIAARLARLAPTEPSGAELPAPLSAREIEVLHLLSIGKSDREIGAALFISYRTVNGHVANIYRKLGVNSRPAAVTEAVRQGLLSPVAETGGW